MCLSRLETDNPDDMLPSMIGYKIVRKSNGKYYPLLKDDGCNGVTVGSGWAWDEISDDWADDKFLLSRYAAGVHAWVDMPENTRDCIPSTVVKVLLRGPLARGKQGEYDVVVYKEMTILGECY